MSQHKALLAMMTVQHAVMQSIPETGCPEGPIFAALMAQGCTYDQFQRIMRPMVQTGILVRNDSHWVTRGPKYSAAHTGLTAALKSFGGAS